eukprot:Rmarinus@m.11602
MNLISLERRQQGPLFLPSQQQRRPQPQIQTLSHHIHLIRIGQTERAPLLIQCPFCNSQDQLDYLRYGRGGSQTTTLLNSEGGAQVDSLSQRSLSRWTLWPCISS